jgi:hypothetical protein
VVSRDLSPSGHVSQSCCLPWQNDSKECFPDREAGRLVTYTGAFEQWERELKIVNGDGAE